MATSQPFLCTNDGNRICVICGSQVVIRSEGRYKNLICFKKDLTTVKAHAINWRHLDIPNDDPYFQFTLASDRLINVREGYIHKNCAVNLRTKYEQYASKYKRILPIEQPIQIGTNDSSASTLPFTRSSFSSTLENPMKKFNCFVCTSTDDLHRIETQIRSEKVLVALDFHLSCPNSSHFAASKRLDIMLKGSSDIFAADVLYHEKCLQSFIRSASNKENHDPMVDLVLSYFCNYITLKICKEKNAYLLHDLLNDSKIICDEHDIPPIFTHTKALRRYLEENIKDIGFTRSGKYVVVHPSDIDPILYSNSTLKGPGLRKNDIMRSFAKMIQRIANEYSNKSQSKWPSSLEDLIDGFDNDQPIVELFNVIYMTVSKTWKSSVSMNEHWFANISSKNTAHKIWSLASDWTALITGIKNSKQIALGLYIHRLTASKEAVTTLWKSGHTLSPNDVRIQNEEFLSDTNDIEGILSGLVLGASTHSSLDNNDFCQDTSTGKNTTHHTNFLLFQPNPPVDGTPLISSNERNTSTFELTSNYKIGKLVTPRCYPNFKDEESSNLINISFKKDILWSLAGGIPLVEGEDLPLLGSWTAFRKSTSEKENVQSLIKYLPANENPPEHGVCKDYLEYLVEVMGILDINEIFVHADEQVYARICQLIWKYKEKFQTIIPLMGGFHQLRVFQRILFKKHGIFGYQEWYADSDVIAEGSSEQAFKGKHYYRCMRIHKEGFDALSQLRIDELTDHYNQIDAQLIENVKSLRRNPSHTIVDNIINSLPFQKLYESFTQTTGSKCEMTLTYLKDVSLMLSMVSAVREGALELHLQAERQFLKIVFAFDHVHYARYNTYQHVLLSELRRTGSDSYQQLLKNGFGCTASSGGRFNTIHGDLETEHFNRETKGTAGPFRSGYSTNIHAVNRWIKTTHSHATLRKAMKKRFRMYITSKHKEMTPRHKKLHESHVKDLKQKIVDYNVEPFKDGPAVNIVTGREIDTQIVKGLHESEILGDKKLKEFMRDTLVIGSKSIFEKISKNNIDTGVKEKKKETSKKFDVLLEEKKAFGIMVSKCQSKEEAFSYPMTSLPLSIANPNGSLYGSDKAKFRNYLIGDFFSLDPEYEAHWIIDCGQAIRQVNPRDTYREFFCDLLDWMLPDKNFLPKKLIIAVDRYQTISTKNLERKERRCGKEEGKRIHVTGFEQKMPKGKQKWIDFLSNGENKNDLMASFGRFLKHYLPNRERLDIEIIFCGEEVWSWNENGFAEKEYCNHEEADTKVALYALKAEAKVVVVAEDCDIFVLLITFFSTTKPKFKWSVRYGGYKYAKIEDIVKNLGNNACNFLIQYHAISGCDTTSYFYRIGKVIPFKNAVEKGNLYLLKELGTGKFISPECIESCKEFIRTVLYKGNSNETYLQTRVRLYDKQSTKSKTTMTIPPDIESCTQHILRCHLTSFIWMNSDKNTIPPISPISNGWILANSVELIPLWFSGSQLPPSCISRKKMNKQTENDGYDADCDRNETEIPKRITRLRKLNVTGPGRKFRKMLPELLIDMDSNENENEQKMNENSNCKLIHNPVLENLTEMDLKTTSDDESSDSSDDWEHYSDFELTGSSDSDWI